MAGLWVVWLVCGWSAGGVASLRMVCGRIGWFVGNLASLCVVWLVYGWFVWFVTALRGLGTF